MNTTTPPKRRGRPTLPEGEAATDQIRIRISTKRKKAYRKAAKESLSKWIISQLDRAAGYTD